MVSLGTVPAATEKVACNVEQAAGITGSAGSFVSPAPHPVVGPVVVPEVPVVVPEAPVVVPVAVPLAPVVGPTVPVVLPLLPAAPLVAAPEVLPLVVPPVPLPEDVAPAPAVPLPLMDPVLEPTPVPWFSLPHAATPKARPAVANMTIPTGGACALIVFFFEAGIDPSA